MSSNARTARFAPFLLALTLLLPAAPAFAYSKDTDRIQVQIQDLQAAVARLQQSNDERMGVMKDLVQQSADSVNKMSLTVETLQRSLGTQGEAQSTKLDQLSGQIQALNDSLDEMKARLTRLEKMTGDIQSQQQSLGAAGAATTAPAPLTTTPMPDPVTQPATGIPPTPPTSTRRGKPAAGVPQADVSAPVQPSAPVGDLYKSALGDYMAAKYSLSAGEFADVIRFYPDHPLSGNSFYYLGEIDYRAGKFDEAVKDYDMVLEHFPDSNKTPVARLHKGQALLELKQNDAAVRELRGLIQRFPASPEASLARSKLSGMGITVTPRRPSAQ